MGLNSLQSKTSLSAAEKKYTAYSIPAAGKALGVDLSRLPFSLKVLVENLLRNEDGQTVKKDDIAAFGTWLKNKKEPRDIAYRPARVLMQDFTGVPAVVDLAAMRDAVAKMGGNAERINPLTPVDLVIDHSVMVDYAG
ncbi:MAG: aconitate hydratase, partial [Rickettsiales bacterium]|nr:aconitate hydratase [Rickettsiales bacterium]